MSDHIHISDEHYAGIRNAYRLWWENKMTCPMFGIVTEGHKPERKPSENPKLWFSNAWDMNISPEQFIDAYDWDISTKRWYGNAFPNFPMSLFGPGVMAAFLGCTPHGTEQTVWFTPPDSDMPLSEMHFTFDENNIYFRRVCDMYAAAMDKWHGKVVVSMVDMGGVLDVLATMRGTENLLMDLYDEPEEVLRCVNELQELWFRYFDHFNSIMAPEAQGYSDWMNIFYEKPGYVLQSDFSFMISPDMFNTFVMPELASSAARLYKAVYHIDGIGELAHLDSLLSIKDIAGYQWAPGAGNPAQMNWDDLLSRILGTGKKLLSWNDGPVALQYPGQLFWDQKHYSADELDAARAKGEEFGFVVEE